MTIIVHLSDLHFGRIDPAITEPLVRAIVDLRPGLVVVSGDLTQRARSRQFQKARDFLAKLPQPQIVVPGNHDIPLYDLFRRFFQPLRRFKRFITEDLHPFFRDDAVAVLGINTARSFTMKHGRINREQMEEIRHRFCPIVKDVVKIVVTHHPFDLAEDAEASNIVGRAQEAMALLSECDVDVLLAGHMHRGLTGHTAKRYAIEGYAAIFVQAGTAMSTRGRGEPNSFNVLHVDRSRIDVERLSWNAGGGHFEVVSRETLRKTEAGWDRAEPIAAEE